MSNEYEKKIEELEHQTRILNAKLDERDAKDRMDLAKKNYDFVQLYKKELKELRALVKANPTAAQVLLIFVEKMNKQNAIIMSFKTLEKITKKTRQTLSKSIKYLREKHFINIIKVGTANAYVINSNVFWSTDNKSKDKFALFTATVIASSSEQGENFEDWQNVKLKNIPIIYPGEQLSLLDGGLENQKEEEQETP